VIFFDVFISTGVVIAAFVFGVAVGYYLAGGEGTSL
jgi:cytochrome bd-type quinol oxidase subunit 2